MLFNFHRGADPWPRKKVRAHQIPPVVTVGLDALT